jgi:hypothetical protein
MQLFTNLMTDFLLEFGYVRFLRFGSQSCTSTLLLSRSYYYLVFPYPFPCAAPALQQSAAAERCSRALQAAQRCSRALQQSAAAERCSRALQQSAAAERCSRALQQSAAAEQNKTTSVLSLVR